MLPTVPDAGKGKRFVLLEFKVVRLRNLSVPFPFIKPIGENQAPSLFKRLFEARLLVDSLDSSVDKSLRLFAPRRNQAPLKELRLTRRCLLGNCQNFLGGCDVIVRNQIADTIHVDTAGPQSIQESFYIF